MKDAKRLADDGIYLNENRSDNPKEMFKFIRSVLSSKRLNTAKSLLDVGCATGELIYYLKGNHPNLSCTGIDVSEAMIELAKARQPNESFICRDILTRKMQKMLQYDIVLCAGVLQIFDDIELPIHNLLSSVRPFGMLVVAGSFNTHNVDVLMRYRRGGSENVSGWETGWNLFSKETIEQSLKSFGNDLAWDWFDFEMPFPLPEQEDPMRTWTISTEHNSNQLINGAAQLLYTKVLCVSVGKFDNNI